MTAYQDNTARKLAAQVRSRPKTLTHSDAQGPGVQCDCMLASRQFDAAMKRCGWGDERMARALSKSRKCSASLVRRWRDVNDGLTVPQSRRLAMQRYAPSVYEALCDVERSDYRRPAPGYVGNPLVRITTAVGEFAAAWGSGDKALRERTGWEIVKAARAALEVA